MSKARLIIALAACGMLTACATMQKAQTGVADGTAAVGSNIGNAMQPVDQAAAATRDVLIRPFYYSWLGIDPGPNPADPQRFDGSYKGRATLVAGTDCPASRNGVMEVGDSQLVLPYTPSRVFVAPIDKDGAVSLRDATASLEGKVDGQVLDVTVKDGECETRFTGHFELNRS